MTAISIPRNGTGRAWDIPGSPSPKPGSSSTRSPTAFPCPATCLKMKNTYMWWTENRFSSQSRTKPQHCVSFPRRHYLQAGYTSPHRDRHGASRFCAVVPDPSISVTPISLMRFLPAVPSSKSRSPTRSHSYGESYFHSTPVVLLQDPRSRVTAFPPATPPRDKTLFKSFFGWSPLHLFFFFDAYS